MDLDKEENYIVISCKKYHEFTELVDEFLNFLYENQDRIGCSFNGSKSFKDYMKSLESSEEEIEELLQDYKDGRFDEQDD